MIGLGSYAFFWQQSDRVPEPLSLAGAFHATRDLGVGLFQICDFAPLDRMTAAELADAAAVARDLGLRIELGTRGTGEAHLSRYLDLARVFDARLVRSMVVGDDPAGMLGDAERGLRASLPAFEDAGVRLALETYEQLATADLVSLVESIGSDALGVCLDPANVVARLETPLACVAAAAPYAINVHAKDFAFARQPGWVGFTYGGAMFGTGLHDYPHLLATVEPRTRGANEIVEHWLPWQGDAESTIRAEREWTRVAIDQLRSMG